MPRPFRIAVPEADLEDLYERLSRTRWPDPIPGTGWEYGADIEYMKELCEYWRTAYDWRAQEAALNAYPQFLSTFDSLDIHYWHVRGTGPSPMPLLLVHGWPGSIYEFHHLIGPLTDPAAHGGDAADAFDVVIPALPGYGFGGKPRERGWSSKRTGDVFDRLMTEELGYPRYGTQGGDWGSYVTRSMAGNHAEHVIGAHLNLFTVPPIEGDTSPEAAAILADRAHFQAEETGYSSLQGTKPMSLAAAQADSPAGTAAWIVEKFRTWSDCDGDVESVFTKDQLLTNVMFYWAPNSAGSSAQMYYETRRDHSPTAHSEVPLGIASFAKEIIRSRREWAAPRYNIVRWTEFERGGHFAAMEQPEALLGDIRAFFRTLR